MSWTLHTDPGSSEVRIGAFDEPGCFLLPSARSSHNGRSVLSYVSPHTGCFMIVEVTRGWLHRTQLISLRHGAGAE
jgi:hypothetical protein